MAYTEAVILRARARLAAENEKKRAEYEAHLAHAYALRPRLREIDRAMRQTAAEAVSACFTRGGDPVQAIARLKKENLALQEERQWILDDLELGDDYLDDSPVCAVCGGTGYAGSGMCECLHELCRQEQKRELAELLPTGKERFENFSLDYYPDRYYPAIGTTAKALMKRNLNLCRRFAHDFQPGAKNLLFSGATGLGKTFLSACIARQVADGGHSVVYVSASRLFADYEAVRFDRAEESLIRRYTDCDLLIIDDLGTEMTTQLTISSLYEVVNRRLLAQKTTLISTNLDAADLEARYKGQIASRLLGCYQLVYFVGDDIRQKIK